MCAQQLIDGLWPGQFARIAAPEDVVEGFQRTGHLEIGELSPELFPDSTAGGFALHVSPPAALRVAYTAKAPALDRDSRHHDGIVRSCPSQRAGRVP